MDLYYLFVFVLAFDRGSTGVIPWEYPFSTCESIKIEMCKILHYNETVYPNLLHHSSQEVAELKLNNIPPIFYSECGHDLKLFVCAIHAPACTDSGVALKPCKSLCENAKSTCGYYWQRFPIAWQNCSNLPEFDGIGSCYDGRNMTEIRPIFPSVVSTTTVPPSRSHDGQQLPTNQGSNTTLLPVQTEVWTKEQFQAMPDHNLLVFNSMSILQLLHDNAKLREEMAALREKIEKMAPTGANNKPDSSVNSSNRISNKTAVDAYEEDVADSKPSQGKCEPITIELCMNMPYNETIMPNLLNHQKQEDAGPELHQFSPLVKLKCSPDLNFFLCALYVPQCTNSGKPLLPCRSLCERARKCERLINNFGFYWPENLDCSKFPISNGSGSCVEKD